MLEIYVCDDEVSTLNFIQQAIEKQILIHEYDMKVKQVYRDPCAMLEALAKQQTKRNIYFLDVELKHPEYDGFLLGREIRKIDPNGTIVYITSFKDLA